MTKGAVPRLLVLTDDGVAPDHVRAVWPAVAGAVPDGVVALTVRYRGLEARPLSSLCAALQGLTPRAPVLVSRRLDVALAAGLAGVHLPAHGVCCDEARRLLGEGALVVRAAHDEAELAAAALGADLALLSPLWSPRSHAQQRPALGAPRFLVMARGARVPVLALGGVTPENAALAVAAGAAGVAVVSAVWSAPDPAQAARQLVQAMTNPKEARA